MGCPQPSMRRGEFWIDHDRFFQVFPRHHVCLPSKLDHVFEALPQLKPSLEAVCFSARHDLRGSKLAYPVNAHDRYM